MISSAKELARGARLMGEQQSNKAWKKKAARRSVPPNAQKG